MGHPGRQAGPSGRDPDHPGVGQLTQCTHPGHVLDPDRRQPGAVEPHRVLAAPLEDQPIKLDQHHPRRRTQAVFVERQRLVMRNAGKGFGRPGPAFRRRSQVGFQLVQVVENLGRVLPDQIELGPPLLHDASHGW